MDYLQRWRIAKIGEAQALLGGLCVDCGTSAALEFDHVDPSTKIGEVTTILYTRNLAEFWAEVEKCVLRCRPCHQRRTSAMRPGPKHGSQRRYRKGCRCAECVARSKADNRRAVELRHERGTAFN